MEILPPSLPAIIPSVLTIRHLIAAYKSDDLSPYHSKRYATRQNYDSLLKRIGSDYGHLAVRELDARTVHGMHKAWVGPGNHVPMAHGLIGMLRTIVRFGATYLNDANCRSVKDILSDMRFSMSKPRTSAITTAQVIAVRKTAHEMGLHSLALAQAIQYSCTFRQKDVIGEIVPDTEPGESILHIDGGWKWMRGVHWREIDRDLILRHVTSKRNKAVEIDLKLAPMFRSELKLIPDWEERFLRGGPIVVSEITGLPWRAYDFRKAWRKVARKAGIPDSVRSMDTRAGAITEALQLGASLQSVRKTATHSSEAQTQAYSRGDTAEIAKVMQIRAAAHQGEA